MTSATLEPGALVTACGGVAAGVLERALDVLDAGDGARRADRLGEVEGDRAGPAAHVEDAAVPVAQVGEQVGRRVRRCSRAVRREDARVVPVEVDVRHGATLRPVRVGGGGCPAGDAGAGTTKARPGRGGPSPGAVTVRSQLTW